MILASNLIIAPIQCGVYLGSLAVINGANSLPAIIKFVKMQIMSILKVSWITNPASLIIAQKFLPQETWVPFFSFVTFLLGKFLLLYLFYYFHGAPHCTALHVVDALCPVIVIGKADSIKSHCLF